MSDTVRILVFGTTKVGKTSLCNLLTNYSDLQPVSDSAKGTTFESHPYRPFNHGSREYVFTDTIGLNESDKGTRPREEALLELASLIQRSEDGYNLLIHVFRGAITATDKANYDLFVRTIAADKIPCILVATGCENVDPMSKWAKENAQAFHDEGMTYGEVVAVCAAKEGRFAEAYAPLRQESFDAVYKAIQSKAAPEPIPLHTPEGDLMEVLLRALRFFYLWAGWYAMVKDTVNETLWNALRKLGFSEKKVAELAHQLMEANKG